MLVALWEWKLTPLNDTEKDEKLNTHFENILTFCLARGCNFVLSWDVTTPLITPVMSITWLGSFGKDFVNMLKSIGFGDLVRLSSSSRQSDRVYLDRIVWDLVGRVFMIQALRQSVKAGQGSSPIGSSLSTWFQVSLCLSPGFCVCRPRQHDMICWELDFVSGFFVFSWLIVWVDGINKCRWCITGGRRCWLVLSYFIIPQISTYIRLFHWYQEWNVHCIIITNDAGMG